MPGSPARLFQAFSEAERRAFERKLWAAYGSGHPCDYCSRPIGSKDVEFEVEASTGTLRFHRTCHQRWELECAEGAMR
jgi:hypothetical protein